MLFCIKLLLSSVEFPKWKVRTGILDVYFPRLQMFLFNVFLDVNYWKFFYKSPFYIFLSLLSFWVEVIWAEFQYSKGFTDGTLKLKLRVPVLEDNWLFRGWNSPEVTLLRHHEREQSGKGQRLFKAGFLISRYKKERLIVLIWDTQNVVHKRIE